VLVEGAAADGGLGIGRARIQRWEDYSQTAVDPADDCTIWYVGDYLRKEAISYTSRIGALAHFACPDAPPTIVTLVEGGILTAPLLGECDHQD
jgi:CTP synthase (UTP-ammonia lyase)